MRTLKTLAATALALLTAATLAATDYTYTSGNTWPPAGFAAGDTAVITGTAGTITLSNSMQLGVTDWVKMNSGATITITNTNNITFRASGTGWAMLDMLPNTAGRRVFRHGQSVALNTLNLDHVIIANGAITNSQGGGMYLSGAANRTETINGDVAFINNAASSSGGGIYSQNGLLFTGTAIFDGNLAGATFASNVPNGVGTTANVHGGAIAIINSGNTLTFQKTAIFLSNTAAQDGGAIQVADGITMTFAEDATFIGNRAKAAGGAIFGRTVTFNGPLTATGNAAGNNGGALRVATKLTINGSFNISDNQTMTAGGGIHAGAFEINATGTFANNTSGGDGGAIYATGNGVFTIGSGITFLNNTAATNGGAIYVSGTSGITLAATTADITFQGNKSGATITGTSGEFSITGGTANAIHFNGATSNLNLQADAGKTIYFYDPVSTAAATTLTVNKTGAGTVIFNEHTSAITADTTVTEGTFKLTNGAIYGASDTAGTFEVKPGATLSIDGELRAGTITIADGALLEVIENGIFKLTSATPATIGTNLTLAGSGTISFNTALNASKIRVGTGAPSAQTLTLKDNITLLDGATIDIDLYSGLGADGYNLSDRVNLDGGSILLAGNNRIDIGTVQTGTFNLGNIGSLYNNITLTINGEVPATVGRQSGALSQSGADLILIASADMSRDMTWTGTGGNTHWDLLSENWTDHAATTRFGGGDRVIFSGTADTPAARTIDISANGVKVSDILVTGTADYKFTGSGGITAAPTYVLVVNGSTGVTTPEGKLTKRGAGTLTFENTGANTFHGGIDIYAGAIAVTTPDQLGTGGAPVTFLGSATLKAADNLTLNTNITIADAQTASLHNSGTGSFTYAGTITGTAATLAKTGPGGLFYTGAADIATLNITDGSMGIVGNIKVANAINIAQPAHLLIPSTAALNTGGPAFTMTNKGTLHIGKAAGATTYAKVTLQGNYASDNGNILMAIGTDPTGNIVISDELAITNNVTGTINILFDQQTPITDITDWSNVKPITTPDPATVTATINCTPIELTNGLLRTMIRNPDGTWTYTQTVSPTLPLLLGVDAASIMIGKTSMASLSQRLVTNRATDPHKLQVWVNGLMADEQIKLNFYRGSKITTTGAQVGADWSTALGKGRLTLGAYYDTATSDMDQSSAISRDASTKTKATGYGAYATYAIGKWYIDLLARAGNEDYDIKVPGHATFSTDGDSTAGSIEIGRSFKDMDGRVNWEPQLQLTYQKHDINNATDYMARTYTIDSADSLEGRAGVRVWLQHEFKPGWKIVPYLRTSYHYEFKGDTQIAVADKIYTNDLGGSRGTVDIGAILQIGRNFGVNAKGSYYFGERTKGFTLDLGCGFFW